MLLPKVDPHDGANRCSGPRTGRHVAYVTPLRGPQPVREWEISGAFSIADFCGRPRNFQSN